MKTGRIWAAAGAAIFGFAWVADAAPTLSATIERIGSFPRRARLNNVRCAINDRGDVGGEFKGTNTPDTIWHRTAEGVETHLDVGGNNHRFGGINENGEIVFTTFKQYSSPWEPVALYRFRPGVGVEFLMESIEVPGNIFGYNNAGQTTGYRASLAGSGSRALRFDPGVGFVDLGNAVTGSTQQGKAINASGQVGASVNRPGGNGIAAVHTPGVGWIALGALGSGNTDVYAINDLGDIVGYSHTASPATTFEAFIVLAGGHMQALGVLPGGERSIANDINNNRWVVGESDYTRPFFWTQETGMIELQSLLPPDSPWTIQRAYDINNVGQIVGEARLAGIQGSFPYIMTITMTESAAPTATREASGVGALHAVLTHFGEASGAGDVNADGAIDAEDIRAAIERIGEGR